MMKGGMIRSPEARKDAKNRYMSRVENRLIMGRTIFTYHLS